MLFTTTKNELPPLKSNQKSVVYPKSNLACIAAFSSLLLHFLFQFFSKENLIGGTVLPVPVGGPKLV